VPTNFGDFQNEVYAEAVHGVTTRYPFDFASIERKASEALPDWVYRYVSAAAGDGRTQRANIAAFSCYGVVPRMMVSPPERDLSISLFGKHLVSPMFLAPIGLVGLCAPDFHGDVAPRRRRRPLECHTRCRHSPRHAWKTWFHMQVTHRFFTSCTFPTTENSQQV
jgi:lactate 2-monooxygenase